jgi:hypothetical protein
VVVLVGAAGWFAASLAGDWKASECDLAKQPTDDLVTWAGAALLLPLVVLLVGVALLWVRGVSPTAGGILTGTALAMLLLMTQELMRLHVLPGKRVGECATTSTFWLAFFSSVVVTAGALVALRNSGLESRRPSVARGALPYLAAAVATTAMVLAYPIAIAGGSVFGNLVNLSQFMVVGLAIALSGSLLVLATGQRHALLGLATAFCLLAALAQLQLWVGFIALDDNREEFTFWRLVEAAVAAVVLVVVWLVQGTVSRPASTASHRSSAPAP